MIECSRTTRFTLIVARTINYFEHTNKKEHLEIFPFLGEEAKKNCVAIAACISNKKPIMELRSEHFSDTDE